MGAAPGVFLPKVDGYVPQSPWCQLVNNPTTLTLNRLNAGTREERGARARYRGYALPPPGT